MMKRRPDVLSSISKVAIGPTLSNSSARSSISHAWANAGSGPFTASRASSASESAMARITSCLNTRLGGRSARAARPTSRTTSSSPTSWESTTILMLCAVCFLGFLRGGRGHSFHTVFAQSAARPTSRVTSSSPTSCN